MDQRKLMDNANTITDMAKVSFIFITFDTFDKIPFTLSKFLKYFNN